MCTRTTSKPTYKPTWLSKGPLPVARAGSYETLSSNIVSAEKSPRRVEISTLNLCQSLSKSSIGSQSSLWISLDVPQNRCPEQSKHLDSLLWVFELYGSPLAPATPNGLTHQETSKCLASELSGTHWTPQMVSSCRNH